MLHKKNLLKTKIVFINDIKNKYQWFFFIVYVFENILKNV